VKELVALNAPRPVFILSPAGPAGLAALGDAKMGPARDLFRALGASGPFEDLRALVR